jgi:hypothetical protein
VQEIVYRRGCVPARGVHDCPAGTTVCGRFEGGPQKLFTDLSSSVGLTGGRLGRKSLLSRELLVSSPPSSWTLAKVSRACAPR